MNRVVLSFCIIASGWGSCAGNDAALLGLCGNGDLNFGEECDGEIYSWRVPYSCALLGYNSSGRPACTPDCRLDPTPCVASGVCGDGIVTPGWEACDGKDNGGETCASLGYHGGRLFCNADCTFDIAQCQRCGDGVVQPEYGELFESGPERCLETGNLGGYVFTEDCVTPSLDRCGEYALIPPTGSLLEPTVALGSGGGILLRGLTTGASPGFTHPRPDCPRLVEIWDWFQTPPRVVGYRHDHTCLQEFLAARLPGHTERVLAEHPVDGSVLQVQGLGDGWIVLRMRQQGYELVRLDSDGAELAVHPVPSDASLQPPRLSRNPGGGVGLATVDADAGLRLWALDPRTGEPVNRLSLRKVFLDAPGTPFPERWEYSLERLHLLAQLAEDEWLMRVAIRRDSDAKTVLLHVRFAAGRVLVEKIDLSTSGVGLVILEGAESAGGGVLTWIHDGGHPRVERVVFRLDGEQVSSHRADLPEGAYLEALGSDGAGGALVFGTVPIAAVVAPWPPKSPGAERAFAFWRLGPDLTVREARFFPSAAANLIDASRPYYCALDDNATLDVDGVVVHEMQRSYDFRDGTLIVAGVYDTTVGFLDEGGGLFHEGDGLPVHTCGIYLLRFR